MNGGSAAKSRLIRCPKCRIVLVEPQDIPVYRCGGCSTYLRAKIRKSNPEVATSGLHETDADQKNTSAGAGSTNKEIGKRIKTIVNDIASKLTRLKSGWTDAISASKQEQNNVDMAQQREPLLTGEFERANDLTGAGIELPRDTPDDQDELNNSGRVAQPGAGASSSGGLRHNRSETRGAPLLTGSTKLVGRAFEENRNVIWSWLTDDEVSIIGIYGMAGAGKTTLLKHICNELLRSPDIYYHVYWVTLSPDVSIHKLQNTIAKRIQLSFSNEEEELGHRAKELSQKLMEKQKWILILDNLCNSFELHEVGIPVPFKGCKLIMTTRSEAVCRQMNSKNNVRVNPLSIEEAWTLWDLQGGFLCCQGQGRKWIEMARLKSGWTLLMTNLILEMASAVFDQLGYALVGMVLAFVALVLATADLIRMARKERMNLLPRKERMSLLPSFHRPSTSTLAPGKPVGTIVEYFGWVGAVWQCFYSTVEYAYARQKRDNPIKMSLLPFLFLSCVVISILIKNRVH